MFGRDPVITNVRRRLPLRAIVVTPSMRYSVFQFLAVMLVIALSLALFVNHRQFRSQVGQYEAEVEERERLENSLELAMVRSLGPGVSLDDYPYFDILVDDVVTVADSTYAAYAELLEERFDLSPSALADCEFHFFRIDHGVDSTEYVVIVRDDRCVKVDWVQMSIGPR
ncbi:hypothetical protein [Roseiconus lacunae]|uniref:hypothetical protein n=1 Tax=Roseiconus lacunae TaxID=2605694 RepID=UPI001E499E4C|nr:hypothetical protein [Roseiconus lacunae]MCD0462017.1 hypothetical protein [Roseiconus lacunae]